MTIRSTTGFYRSRTRRRRTWPGPSSIGQLHLASLNHSSRADRPISRMREFVLFLKVRKLRIILPYITLREVMGPSSVWARSSFASSGQTRLSFRSVRTNGPTSYRLYKAPLTMRLCCSAAPYPPTLPSPAWNLLRPS